LKDDRHFILAAVLARGIRHAMRDSGETGSRRSLASAANAARNAADRFKQAVGPIGRQPALPFAVRRKRQSRLLSQRCLAYATSRAGLRYPAGYALFVSPTVKQTSIHSESFFDSMQISHFFALMDQHHFRAVNWLTRTPQ
jgi:hypothetical protein